MKQRVEKIKNHIRENKQIYIGTGLGFAAGVITILVVKKLSETDEDNASNENKQVVVAWKTGDVTQNIIQTALSRRGHPGNLILCNETGEVFASQARAAAAMNIWPSNLSSHLNGKNDSVGGYTFTNLGEAQ